jgi:hypothetical protein
VLGDLIGLRATLAIGATVFLAASLACTRTRVRSIHGL